MFPAATSGSRLAFLSKPLVKRLDRVGEIRRNVSRAMILQEMQLIGQAESRRIEIEAFVDTGRPAEQDTTHEALGPSQIVLAHRRIGSHVVVELLARRSAQARLVCVPKTLSELMTWWNRLSWRNDRAALFLSGRLGLTI